MPRFSSGLESDTPLGVDQLGELGTAPVDQSVGTAPVDQSVGTAPVDQSVETLLQDMIKNEDEITINKPLAVLFSHSSRIRCFLDMLYPANNPSKSIYQLMKDYKEENGVTGWKKKIGLKKKGNLNIKFKFYNCVVFVLKKIGDDYYLCMKHEGIPIVGEKERIGLSEFRDLMGINILGDRFNTDTYIKVTINDPNKTAAKGSFLSRRRTQYNPSQTLKQLLNEKYLCIIRHGQSTHNAGQGHGYTDTSLTRSGVIDAARVAQDILNFFKQMIATNDVSLYVSELFRTQQTAMIFVNVLALYSKYGPQKTIFTSTASNPIQLIVVPCNHEFSERKLGSGSCYKNQSERAYWFQNKTYKKENVPEHRPEIKNKRINVTFEYDPKYYQGKEISYFHLNNTYYEMYGSKPCESGVFYYMVMDIPESIPASLTDEDYTGMSVAARYNFITDQYVTGRKNYFGPRDWYARRSWKSSGGSLKKRKKRKTLRRKSKRFTKKRFTKKRNSRRTNKKKRLTNKKRFTKRR